MIINSSQDIITRDELYELVWKEPIAVLSRKNELSEYTIRKACKALNIPTPKAGYWENIRQGKKLNRQALPNDPYVATYTYISNIHKAIGNFPTSSSGLLHPLVESAKQSLTAADKTEYNKHNGLLSCSKDDLDIRVSESMVNRAIRWISCFMDSAKARHHSISIENGNTYIVVFGQAIKIYLREITKLAVPKSKWINAPLVPTGILAFKMEGYWGKEWRDGISSLEEQLINILDEIEIKARNLQEKSKQQEIEVLADREIEKAALLQRQLAEKELEAFKELLANADRWQKAQSLKAYIREWKAKTLANNELTPEMAAKIEWATKKADWYDPETNAPDPVLTGIDKNTLLFKP